MTPHVIRIRPTAVQSVADYLLLASLQSYWRYGAEWLQSRLGVLGHDTPEFTREIPQNTTKYPEFIH